MKNLAMALADFRQPEYPTEYILARLPARVATFSAGCDSRGEEDPWRRLQKEYAWLYSRMNSCLRHFFAPVFFYFELRTISTALRLRAAGEDILLSHALTTSLLSRRLKSRMLEKETVHQIIAELETYLAPLGKNFYKLTDSYKRGGFAALENRLLSAYLDTIRQGQFPAEIKDFLIFFIMRHDLLCQAKQKRWHLKNISGLLTDTELTHWGKFAVFGLKQFREHESGESVSQLDAQLLHELEKNYKRRSRLYETPTLILYYIWHCFLTMQNSGLKKLSPFQREARPQLEMSA